MPCSNGVCQAPSKIWYNVRKNDGIEIMNYQTKQRISGTIRNLKTFVYNLMYFATRSQEEDDCTMLRNLVLSLPREVKEKYEAECTYVESLSPDELKFITFPYPDDEKKHGAGMLIGKEKGLFYVLHAGKKKLFFPGRDDNYYDLVYREGLLGSGSLVKSPHCYQDEDFKVEEGDVLLDVGCAEAIFALDNIEKVAKAYLFELETVWLKPLRYTFAPYVGKTVIINKLVADRTTRRSIRLVDAVACDMSADVHFFVKMDIEGWERKVIESNAEFFKNAKIKLSCCVYHRQDDAQVIEAMLREMGYKTRFSDGYMLPTMNGIHYPYFRHGVIYAQNY